MSHLVRVSDPVYKHAENIASARDVSVKEAIAIMAREGGYDV